MATLAPGTNSQRQDSLNLLGSVGIDTIGISFPVADYDQKGCTANVSNYGTESEGWTYRRRLEGGGFVGFGAGGMAWAEASLPKRLSVDRVNDDALPVELVHSAVAALVTEVCERATPTENLTTDGIVVSPLNPRIVRLDVVRDFDLLDSARLGPMMDALAEVPHAGRTKVSRWADPSRGSAETLTVGPRSWGATLYDKHAESSSAREGRLRFEARLRRRQLTSAKAREAGGHIGYLADVRPDKVDRVRRAWFGTAGFDREIVTPQRLFDRTPGLKLQQRLALVGYWQAVSEGSRGSVSRSTDYRYRKLSDDLGIVMATRPQAEAAEGLRLDYETGRECHSA